MLCPLAKVKIQHRNLDRHTTLVGRGGRVCWLSGADRAGNVEATHHLEQVSKLHALLAWKSRFAYCIRSI